MYSGNFFRIAYRSQISWKKFWTPRTPQNGWEYTSPRVLFGGTHYPTGVLYSLKNKKFKWMGIYVLEVKKVYFHGIEHALAEKEFNVQ